MRWRMTAVAAVGVSACFEGTGPYTPPRPPDAVDVTMDFCQEPVQWFAYKNEGYEWVYVLTPFGPDGLTFPARPRVTVVTGAGFFGQNSSFSEITVRNITAEEAEAWSCDDPIVGTNQMSGSIKAATEDDLTIIAMGEALDLTSGSENYLLVGLPLAKPEDLVALTLVSPFGDNPAKVIVRRDIPIVNGAVIPVLDFTSSEARPVDSIRITLPAQMLMFGDSQFWSGLGTQVFVGTSFSGSNELVLPVLPSALHVPGDRHRIHVSGASGGLVYHPVAPRDTILSAPVPIAAAQIDTAATAPALRPRVRLVAQSEYPSFATADFQQVDGTAVRSIRVVTSAGYRGSATQWEMEVPDLRGSGSPVAWWLKAGPPVTTAVSAYNARMALYFGETEPLPGETMRWVRIER